MAVPDLAANVESLGFNRPRRLRILAVLAGMIFLAYLPLLTGRAIYIRNGRSTNDVMVFVLLPAIYVAVMVLLPIFLARRAPESVAFDCIWARWIRSELAWFLLLPLAFIVLGFVISDVQRRTGLPLEWGVASEHGYEGYRKTWVLVWMTICGVLLAPIAEEFLWRGYVQGSLMRAFHPIVAILIQAAFFGLMHDKPVLGVVGTTTHGLICGLWRWRRRTLVPVIVIHILANSSAFSYKWADWRELATVKRSHDYAAEFMELSTPAGYEPNDDARQEYDKAFQLVVAPTQEIQDISQQYPTLWSDEERTQAEEWLASNAEALSLMEEGAQKPYYWPEYKPDREGAALFSPPHGREMRHLHMALNLRALVEVAQNQHGKALNDVTTCYRAGRHLLQCRDTMSQMAGRALYGLASQTARRILFHEDISPELMTDLQRQLEGFAAEQPVRFDFRAEQFFPLDMIQGLFTDDGHGGGHIPRCAFSLGVPRDGLEYTVFDMAEAADSDISEWKKLDRRRTTEDVRQYYRVFEQATAMAPWDYERSAGEVKSAMERIAKGNPFIRTFSVNTRLMHLSAKARADLDSVITILAILRYRADRQGFPETLEQLVAEGYLKKIPRDPFSDGALIYKRTEDDFLLYSCGADFDDDGGTPSKWGEGKEGGDQVFWPVSEKD